MLLELSQAAVERRAAVATLVSVGPCLASFALHAMMLSRSEVRPGDSCINSGPHGRADRMCAKLGEWSIAGLLVTGNPRADGTNAPSVVE
jgi:hypothetical protein